MLMTDYELRKKSCR